jgi:hypothetical protein
VMQIIPRELRYCHGFKDLFFKVKHLITKDMGSKEASKVGGYSIGSAYNIMTDIVEVKVEKGGNG